LLKQKNKKRTAPRIKNKVIAYASLQ